MSELINIVNNYFCFICFVDENNGNSDLRVRRLKRTEISTSHYIVSLQPSISLPIQSSLLSTFIASKASHRLILSFIYYYLLPCWCFFRCSIIILDVYNRNGQSIFVSNIIITIYISSVYSQTFYNYVLLSLSISIFQTIQNYTKARFILQTDWVK